MGTVPISSSGGLRLFDFSSEDDLAAWYAINDGVMGGVSSGRMTRTADGTAAFEGRVSLENNGGFASVRSRSQQIDLSEYAGLRVRVRGDGRRYKINLKTDTSFDGLLYRVAFDTQADRWQTVDVPFGDFESTYRGRVVEDAHALDLARVRSLGLMISDKQAGLFALGIRWIDAFSEEAHPRVRTAADRPERT